MKMKHREWLLLLAITFVVFIVHFRNGVGAEPSDHDTACLMPGAPGNARGIQASCLRPAALLQRRAATDLAV